MIHLNGTLVPSHTASIPMNNRGFLYGDALFETIRVQEGKILFWEDHYFRLMASMRILRMEIPMHFTPEFLSESIIDTIKANHLQNDTARIKIIVNRNSEGLYTPQSNTVEYAITATLLTTTYEINEKSYEVTIFKDHYVATGLLSTVKSTNRLINILGSIFAKENDFDNCLVVNTNKMIIEALNGNIFLVKGNVIKTPPTEDGCIKGVLRTQLIAILKASTEFEIEEVTISPFELQQMDELFITNVITGIQPITKYKKKTYTTTVAQQVLALLLAKTNTVS